MANEYWEKEINITTKGGNVIKARAWIVLKEEISLDGDICTVDCCSEYFDLFANGKQIFGGFEKFKSPIKKQGIEFYGKYGHSYFLKEHYLQLKGLYDEMQKHPKLVLKKENAEKENKKMEKIEAEQRKNGLCPKCHTYCYGDCEA